MYEGATLPVAALSLFFLPSFVRAEWVPRASFLGFSGNSQTPFRCNFSRHAHSLYRFSLSLSFPFSIPFFFSFGLSFDFQAHSFPYRESERKREHISYLSSCSCLPPFWCLRGRAAPAVKSALLLSLSVLLHGDVFACARLLKLNLPFSDFACIMQAQ